MRLLHPLVARELYKAHRGKRPAEKSLGGSLGELLLSSH